MPAAQPPHDPSLDPMGDLQHRRFRLRHLVDWIRARQSESAAPVPHGSSIDLLWRPGPTPTPAMLATLRRWSEAADATGDEGDKLWSSPGRLESEFDCLGDWVAEVPADALGDQASTLQSEDLGAGGPSAKPSTAAEDLAGGTHQVCAHWLRTGCNAPAWAIRRDLYCGYKPHMASASLRLVHPDPSRHVPGWCMRYAIEVRMTLGMALQRGFRQIAATHLPKSGISSDIQHPRGLLDHRVAAVYTSHLSNALPPNKDALCAWIAGLDRWTALPVPAWWHNIAGGLIEHLHPHELVSLAPVLSLSPPEHALLDAAAKQAPMSQGNPWVVSNGTATHGDVSDQYRVQLHAGESAIGDLAMIHAAMVSPLTEADRPDQVRLACQRRFEAIALAPTATAMVPRIMAFDVAIRLFQMGLLVDLRSHTHVTSAVAWAILRPIYSELAQRATSGTRGSFSHSFTPAAVHRELWLMDLHLDGDQLLHHMTKLRKKPMMVQSVLNNLHEAYGQPTIVPSSAIIARATICVVPIGNKNGDWEATIAMGSAPINT